VGIRPPTPFIDDDPETDNEINPGNAVAQRILIGGEQEAILDKFDGGLEPNEARNAILLEDESEIDAVEIENNTSPIDVASAIASQLLCFHSCTNESHTALRDDPTIDHASNKHLTIRGLAELFDQCNIPVPRMDRLPTPQEISVMPQRNWQRIFEGHNTEIPKEETNSKREESDLEPEINDPRAKLCMNCSQTHADSATIQYDFDSFLGYAQSLAFARHGLQINLAPKFAMNISTDIHLYTVVIDTSNPNHPRERPIKLYRVPHIYLGRVINHEDITVYIFFPNMWFPEKKTNFPRKGDREASSLLRQ